MGKIFAPVAQHALTGHRMRMTGSSASVLNNVSSLEVEPPCFDTCPCEAMDVEYRLVRFDSQAAQPPRRKGTRIDVDAAGMKFHVRNRAMPVHDNFPEFLVAIEKFVPDPEQVFVRLLRQRNAGPHARMNKEKVSATE